MSALTVFIIFAIVFFLILLFIGYATKKWAKDASDYVLAGREVGLVLNITGVMAILFAGTVLAVVPNFAMVYGFWGAMTWGITFACGYILYAVVMGSYLRRCGSTTISEWMETRYDGRVRTVTAIGGVLGMCGILANNIAAFASSLSVFLGIPAWIAIITCFAVMILFTFFSGMWAVNATNIFQAIIGVIALPMLAILVSRNLGGFDFINSHWPVESSWLTAGFTGLSLRGLTVKYPSTLTFIILNAFFLIWGSNYYYLRIVSCRTEKVAKASCIIAAIIMVPLIMAPLALTGVFAAAQNPMTFAPVGTVAGTAAYGFMMIQLAAVAASFMMVASLAASISTGSTALMGASSLASRDIYQRNFRPDATSKQMLGPNRIIMVVIGIVTLLLCWFPGGPTYLFAFANSWLGPPAVLLLFGAFWRRFSAKAAFWSVLIGMAAMMVFTILDDLTKIWKISAYMHSGVAGIIVTVIVAVIINLFSKPKYYGEPSWNPDPETGARTDVELNPEELQMLELIRSGMDEMVELVDYVGKDSRFVTVSVERLDQGGYLKRKALTGAGFYSFSITGKGRTVLPEQNQREKELGEAGLTPLTVKYVTAMIQSPASAIRLLEDAGMSSGQIVAVNSALTRKGYVGQKGIMRRYYFATAKGEQAAERLKALV